MSHMPAIDMPAAATAVVTTRAVKTGTGLQGGGDLSQDRTIALANTAVTAGTYENADITVDAQGRITSAQNGRSALPFFVVTDREYGATGDGTTDDSEAIRAAIAACAAAGGGTVYFPAGTYVISRISAGNEACLYITGDNITLQGESRQGAILKLKDGQDGFTRPIRLQGADDVTICHLTIDGNKANQSVEEHRAGIFAGSCKRLHIHNITSFHNAGDGIDIWQNCEDVLIEYCYCYDNDRDGVALNGSGMRRVTVRKCQLVGNTNQQVDVEVADGPLYDLTVDNCYLSAPVAGTDLAIAISGTDKDNQSVGFIVTNNYIDGGMYGVWVKSVTIANNRIVSRAADTECPLKIDRKSEDVVITGNHIECNTPSGGVTVAAVLIQGASSDDKPSNILVTGNYIETKTNLAGIYVPRVVSCEISNNIFVGNATNTNAGISVWSTEPTSPMVDTFIVRGNTVVDFQRGILVGGSSATSTISDVVVANNVIQRKNNGGATIGIDFDATYPGAVQQAAVMGNTFLGGIVAYIYAYPTCPVLVGGNRFAGGIYSCEGTPEGVITEDVGAIAIRRDGSAGTVTYIKNSAPGDTGWVPVGGAVATGTITCVAKASLVDSDYITIGDGLSAPRLYEFDTAGDGATAGRIQVDVSTDTTAAEVAARLKAAISANQPALAVTDNADGTLSIAHKIAGTFGNATITENVADAGFSVSGMSGGVDPAR